VTQDDIESVALERRPQGAASSPYAWRAAHPDRAEPVDGRADGGQGRGQAPVEAQSKVGLHDRDETPLAREREQGRLHAAPQIPTVDVKNPH